MHLQSATALPGIPYLHDGVVFHGLGSLLFAELDVCIIGLPIEDQPAA